MSFLLLKGLLSFKNCIFFLLLFQLLFNVMFPSYYLLFEFLVAGVVSLQIIGNLLTLEVKSIIQAHATPVYRHKN